MSSTDTSNSWASLSLGSANSARSGWTPVSTSYTAVKRLVVPGLSGGMKGS
ncbi:hypothetical protein [Streptomyces lavendulae]|uniref:hypothetical protein n=1 Tax=Streptomyces lavendulae TaxID=1914 RepID=UPI00255369F6|nr:hypothetical protein [Streptomyces lavendulae]